MLVQPASASPVLWRLQLSSPRKTKGAPYFIALSLSLEDTIGCTAESRQPVVPKSDEGIVSIDAGF